MRYDRNYACFSREYNWSKFVKGIGYVPTDETPECAIKAMAEFDLYTYGTDLNEYLKSLNASEENN